MHSVHGVHTESSNLNSFGSVGVCTVLLNLLDVIWDISVESGTIEVVPDSDVTGVVISSDVVVIDEVTATIVVESDSNVRGIVTSSEVVATDVVNVASLDVGFCDISPANIEQVILQSYNINA